ncbi:MAG: GMC family oxidoreductase, partial [Chloroflexia bacterium]|nr:GMC family oxidoreductase [Chloroflexia bacterium]
MMVSPPVPAISGADFDVVIVGSGVAGALIGARLAEAGARVVLVEAGPRTDRAEAVEGFRGGAYPYPSTDWAPQPSRPGYIVQGGPVNWTGSYVRRVGGSTWHWLGNCPRLLPSDFEMKTRFGVGVDWPISYDDLEAWYGIAEQELGVAGDDEAETGSPRSSPYPMPPIPLSSGDLLFTEAAAAMGLRLAPIPQARNSVDGYQGRPICCGNATCYPICPIQAKYDATIHVDLAERAGARVIENAVVFRVDVNRAGKVTGIRYRTPDRDAHTITGRIYVIAANGVETPKLLLISRSEATPNGVANTSDLVGRNLSDHLTAITNAISPRPYRGTRGPLQLAGFDEMREGDFRAERAAFAGQINHSVGNPLALARQLIRQGLAGPELFQRIGDTAPYQVGLAALLEQLPDPANRIVPDETQTDALGIPLPNIIYAIDDYTRAGKTAADALNARLLDAIGAIDRVASDDMV